MKIFFLIMLGSILGAFDYFNSSLIVRAMKVKKNYEFIATLTAMYRISMLVLMFISILAIVNTYFDNMPDIEKDIPILIFLLIVGFGALKFVPQITELKSQHRLDKIMKNSPWN